MRQQLYKVRLRPFYFTTPRLTHSECQDLWKVKHASSATLPTRPCHFCKGEARCWPWALDLTSWALPLDSRGPVAALQVASIVCQAINTEKSFPEKLTRIRHKDSRSSTLLSDGEGLFHGSGAQVVQDLGTNSAAEVSFLNEQWLTGEQRRRQSLKPSYKWNLSIQKGCEG